MPLDNAPLPLDQYYKEKGYAICRKLVDPSEIDDLLSLYGQEIVPSKSRFFRQNTNRYEHNQIDEYGYVRQSFLDPHAYEKFPAFRAQILNILFSRAMRAALRDVTGHRAHNLMQSMLFDANVGTPAHQDWWYLDSVPNGSLLGAWIALEDIDERAGRFYVIPGSQRHVFHDDSKNMPHDTWLGLVADYVDGRPAEISAPALEKGDVLFWNSRTVHGSLPTRDPAFSRKSLTAHFLPDGLMFGNLFTAKPWINFAEYEGNKYFSNQPEYSFKSEIVSKVKTAIYGRPTLMRLARKLQRRSLSDL